MTHIVQPNLYANIFYDQVWAFALALNGSLATLEERNISLTEMACFTSKKRITEVLSREITNISFEGASSQMNSMAPIVILRVNNESVVLEGVYNQLSESLNISTETVPRDEILRRYNLTDPLRSGNTAIHTYCWFCNHDFCSSHSVRLLPQRTRD